MRLKILLSLLSLVFLFPSLKGQDAFRDEVILNNKSRLVGKITEYEPNSHVILILAHGAEIRLESADIKKVKMAKSRVARKIDFRKGVHFRTNVSVLSGDSNNGYSVGQSITYHFSRWLGLGGGISLDNYYSQSGRNLIPLFLEARSYLSDTEVSPFISLRSGFSIAFADEELGQIVAEGGWMFNPQLGYRLSSNDSSFEIFGGLKFQYADYVFQSSERRLTEEILFKRLELGAALTF